jgi:hypothetical protein
MLIGLTGFLGAQTPARYDRAAEKSLAGTIKAVVSYPASDGSYGVHFDLETATGMVNVHVGPAAFIGEQNFCFFAEDKVQIVGAKVTTDGRTAYWAKAVMNGANVLVLRNEDGTPKWTPGTDGTDGCGVAHHPLARTTEY